MLTELIRLSPLMSLGDEFKVYDLEIPDGDDLSPDDQWVNIGIVLVRHTGGFIRALFLFLNDQFFIDFTESSITLPSFEATAAELASNSAIHLFWSDKFAMSPDAECLVFSAKTALVARLIFNVRDTVFIQRTAPDVQ